MQSLQMANATPRQSPRVLVLLAAYNGGEWLREQLESILAQEGVDLQVLIGDDASLDGTRDLVRSTWGCDARVHLEVREKGSGSAGANFRQLFREADCAGYDFIALADQDDIWHPEKLAAAIGALRRTGAGGYSCAVQSFWSSGHERVLRQSASIRVADFLFEGAGQGCTFVIRQALFARIRQFCIEYPEETEALHYHDWLIYLLVRSWGLDWYFDRQVWMRYRQHANNEIGSRGGLKSVSKRLDLIRNGWYKNQIAAVLKIAQTMQNDHPIVVRFAVLFQRSPSAWRSLSMLEFFMRYGRRRLSDRAVMVVAVLAGWL